MTELKDVLPLAKRALEAMRADTAMEVTPKEYRILWDAVLDGHPLYGEISPGEVDLTYVVRLSTWDNALREVCHTEGWPVPSHTSVKVKIPSGYPEAY
jgi:hypothetical protein